jgi:hypothetical protein
MTESEKSPRVADLPAKWKADWHRYAAEGNAMPNALTCAIALEQALALEPNVTVTAEALRLTVLLQEAEAHVADLLKERDALRKAHDLLKERTKLPEPKSVAAVKLALKLVTGDDYMTSIDGQISIEDARDILWQKLSADFGTDRALQQCVRLLIHGSHGIRGHRPRARSRAMAHDALLRLIGVLAVGAVR